MVKGDFQVACYKKGLWRIGCWIKGVICIGKALYDLAT